MTPTPENKTTSYLAIPVQYVPALEALLQWHISHKTRIRMDAIMLLGMMGSAREAIDNPGGEVK